MKKLLGILLCGVLAAGTLSLAACGKPTDPGYSADAHTITVFRGRESGMVDGTYDEAVKKAIEEKFKQDTGIEINLKVSLYSGDELSTTVEKQWGQTRVDLDGVVHFLGEDSSVILNYAKAEDSVKEIKPLLEQYGQNVLAKIREGDEEHLAERSGYVPVGDSYVMNAIPSVNNEHQYGVIVRKDFMKQLYQEGKIALDPEKYDVLNEGYENMTFSQFSDMLYQMKSIAGMRYPITAKAWDINRIFGPVFETDLYSTLYDEESGTYMPPQMTQGAAELMDVMWRWAKDGVWEKESGNMSDSQRLQYFLNGWTGVYITYPNITNLISACRALKAADSTAEYMMIAPPADDNGVVRGYQKVQRAFYGMMLPYKSDDAEVLVRYLDWMYSDPDNYELCLYGVKGEHWVEGEDVVMNGITYKTWEYPANKTDEFNEKTPYSGMYCLLPNTNVSNRIRGDYDFTERNWYSLCTDVFPAYIDNKVEGVWIKEAAPGSQALNQGRILEYNYVNVRGICWSGTGNADMLQLMEQYRATSYRDCSDYLSFLDTSIKAAVDYYKTAFQ